MRSPLPVLRRLCIIFCLLVAGPALAVQPDEILADPELETRAREISQLLRCPVCQGETIDESNAPVARDLRLYVRERLQQGDSDDEVIDAVVARFGEFVLFQPRPSGINLILWLAAPALVAVALAIAFFYLLGRGREMRREEMPPEPLSDDESRRLKEILRD